MEKHTGKFVVGMVSGALVGTAIALLVAPKAGKETRKAIRSKAGQVATTLRQQCGKHRGVDAVQPQPAENWEKAA
jgi:gas vesicle protein